MNNPQISTPLLTKLAQLANKNHAAFYVPGHKRGQGISPLLSNLMGKAVFEADLPELPELDSLFAPEGVIKQAQELASEAFGADKTWFLINGSTCGILAAILATCNAGDKIILPRNIHQSAIFGLILSGAIPIFINPKYNHEFDLNYCITPQQIETTLQKHSDVKAVMVVYPTYHGVCGDLKKIADVAHKYNIPLLVDEAHGAHFNFHPELPPSALECGADLTIQSTHKVLGAMTQASMLHLKSNKIDQNRINKALQLVESSSPSYLLLASLDAARQQIAIEGKDLLKKTLQLAKKAKEKLSQLEYLSIFNQDKISPEFINLDETRLTVNVTKLGLTGYEADEILDQQLGVTAELPSLTSLTFVISIGNNQTDIDKLIEGFTKLKKYKKDISKSPFNMLPLPYYSVASISPREAFFANNKSVNFDDSIGYISAETICPYPPGIPILIQGEKITAEALEYLRKIIHYGGIITGSSDSTLKTLKVISE